MWFKVLQLLFPLAATLIENYLRRNSENEQSKRAWLDFLDKVQSDPNVSVKLRKKFKEQIDEFKRINKKDD